MERTKNLKRIHTHRLYIDIPHVFMAKIVIVSEGQIKELQNMQTINKFIP